MRVVALGSPYAGDDAFALEIGSALGAELGANIDYVAAGLPGPGLVDLLDCGGPVLLLDVVRSGSAPGTIHELPLAELGGYALASAPLTSHGFGPSEALRLAAALGRSRPRGVFLGIEGESFELGAPLSPAVERQREAFSSRARTIVEGLG